MPDRNVLYPVFFGNLLFLALGDASIAGRGCREGGWHQGWHQAALGGQVGFAVQRGIQGIPELGGDVGDGGMVRAHVVHGLGPELAETPVPLAIGVVLLLRLHACTHGLLRGRLQALVSLLLQRRRGRQGASAQHGEGVVSRRSRGASRAGTHGNAGTGPGSWRVAHDQRRGQRGDVDQGIQGRRGEGRARRQGPGHAPRGEGAPQQAVLYGDGRRGRLAQDLGRAGVGAGGVGLRVGLGRHEGDVGLERQAGGGGVADVKARQQRSQRRLGCVARGRRWRQQLGAQETRGCIAGVEGGIPYRRGTVGGMRRVGGTGGGVGGGGGGGGARRGGGGQRGARGL